LRTRKPPASDPGRSAEQTGGWGRKTLPRADSHWLWLCALWLSSSSSCCFRDHTAPWLCIGSAGTRVVRFGGLGVWAKVARPLKVASAKSMFDLVGDRNLGLRPGAVGRCGRYQVSFQSGASAQSLPRTPGRVCLRGGRLCADSAQTPPQTPRRRADSEADTACYCPLKAESERSLRRSLRRSLPPCLDSARTLRRVCLRLCAESASGVADSARTLPHHSCVEDHSCTRAS